MRQILAFLGSLGVAIVVTAAGLYFYVQTLAAFGVALIGLVVILWLHEWARKPSQVPAERHPEIPGALITAEENDEHREEQRRHVRIVNEIGSTAHNVGWALGERSAAGMARALPGLQSTMLTLSKAYDLKIPTLSELATERSFCRGKISNGGWCIP